MIEHIPDVRNVTVVPETVHTLVVFDAKLTASPEEAVAESVSGVPTVCAAGVVNVMLCAVGLAEVSGPTQLVMPNDSMDNTIKAAAG